ncbi:unnamed protein product [Linum tenue]|uniref:Uncharacterized protein n=1 Tax=Linum tenue TaxID=586396 RepID=A0AAV0JBB3_9ROSI|nr:unnamed protein product [Linum tenue]
MAAAATVASSLPPIPGTRSRNSSFFSPTSVATTSSTCSSCRKVGLRMPCSAMVQQAVQGAPAAYAKEMERLSAKESLLLAVSSFRSVVLAIDDDKKWLFKDAGGFEALVTGKLTEVQQIDVNERITGLERLNPTPRPTTRFPSDLANFSNMDVVIKEGKARATANMKLLYSIESTVTLSSQLTVEGPLRMKEEYIEGILETPKVIEEAVPEQLKGVLGQAISTVQQLPVPIRDLIAGGLRIPLRLNKFVMQIMRDAAGVPEVLTRLEAPALAIPEVVSEYES